MLLDAFFVMQILAEEITPTLKRLKDERSSYLEFQKVTREVEQLSRFSIAYQFVQDEVKMSDHKRVIAYQRRGISNKTQRNIQGY